MEATQQQRSIKLSVTLTNDDKAKLVINGYFLQAVENSFD